MKGLHLEEFDPSTTFDRYLIPPPAVRTGVGFFGFEGFLSSIVYTPGLSFSSFSSSDCSSNSLLKLKIDFTHSSSLLVSNLVSPPLASCANPFSHYMSTGVCYSQGFRHTMKNICYYRSLILLCVIHFQYFFL